MKTLQMPLLAVVLLVSCNLGWAEDQHKDLRTVLSDLAQSVKAVVEKEGQSHVRIGVFSPLGLDDSNGGAGISGMLAQALGAMVDTKSTLEVQGGYGFIEQSRGSGVKLIKIKAKIIDTMSLEEKKLFLPLEGLISSNPDIAKLLGITGRINPDGSHTERNKEIQKLKEQPSVHIHGSRQTLISSKPGSPFSIELRVKPLKDHETMTATARRAEDKAGEAFVSIAQDELYEVRVLNNGPQEAAVALSIDGIDQFTFSDDRHADGPKKGLPFYTHFIVPPAKEGKAGEVIIPGWHKTVDPNRRVNFLSFMVTEYGKGAASKFPTLSQGKIGVVTAAFSLSFPKGTARSGSETGFGPPVEVKQTAVERTIDPPHDFISVRYLRYLR